jgi:hypothetical protein
MSSADFGRNFTIPCSAVTKMGTRLKQRLEKDRTPRETIRRMAEVKVE